MYPRPFVRAIFIFLGDRRPFDTSVYNSGLYRLRKSRVQVKSQPSAAKAVLILDWLRTA